jgi:hypothetical protein
MMDIWRSYIAKYLLAIWHYVIAKCTLAIWRHPIGKHPIAKYTLTIFGNLLLLKQKR